MNKKYLLSSVMVSIAFLYANQGMAQCVSTQDCTALGYTETSCPNGNGVKCPFGNKWFCGMTKDECEVAVCEDFGFIYECNGQHEVGVGKACGTRYTECECEAGYERTEGICAKPCAAVKDEDYGGTYYIDCVYKDPYYEDGYKNGRCICEKYEGYALKSKEFVNGEWKCEYNSYKTEVRSNCLPLY